jgi:hypothetical protein
MAAITERMAAANALCRKPASDNDAAFANGVHCVLRATRRKATAAVGAEHKKLRWRNCPAIQPNRKNQNVLEQIHLIFKQAGAIQRGQKILFHFGKFFPGDGIARDQNQFHGRRDFVLMQPETFAKQAPRATAFRRAADFPAGDNTEFGRHAIRQLVPVGDEAALREPLAHLPYAREITVLAQPHGAGQAQTFRRFNRHERLNGCKAFAAFATTIAQSSATAFGGFAGKKSMLSFAPDFRWLILAFHKFK